MSSEAQQQKLRKRIAVLQKRGENKICLDCPEKRPTWATLIQPFKDNAPLGMQTLCAFVCLNCAGAHRTLGTHLCRVKSTNLDTWTEQEVELAENGNNNTLINSVYEATLPEDHSAIKPLEGAHAASRHRYIRAKYEDREYYSKGAHYKLIKEFKSLQVKQKAAVASTASSNGAGPRLMTFLNRQTSLRAFGGGSQSVAPGMGTFLKRDISSGAQSVAPGMMASHDDQDDDQSLFAAQSVAPDFYKTKNESFFQSPAIKTNRFATSLFQNAFSPKKKRQDSFDQSGGSLDFKGGNDSTSQSASDNFADFEAFVRSPTRSPKNPAPAEENGMTLAEKRAEFNASRGKLSCNPSEDSDNDDGDGEEKKSPSTKNLPPKPKLISRKAPQRTSSLGGGRIAKMYQQPNKERGRGVSRSRSGNGLPRTRSVSRTRSADGLLALQQGLQKGTLAEVSKKDSAPPLTRNKKQDSPGATAPLPSRGMVRSTKKNEEDELQRARTRSTSRLRHQKDEIAGKGRSQSVSRLNARERISARDRNDRPSRGRSQSVARGERSSRGRSQSAAIGTRSSTVPSENQGRSQSVSRVNARERAGDRASRGRSQSVAKGERSPRRRGRSAAIVEGYSRGRSTSRVRGSRTDQDSSEIAVTGDEKSRSNSRENLKGSISSIGTGWYEKPKRFRIDKIGTPTSKEKRSGSQDKLNKSINYIDVDSKPRSSKSMKNRSDRQDKLNGSSDSNGSKIKPSSSKSTKKRSSSQDKLGGSIGSCGVDSKPSSNSSKKTGSSSQNNLDGSGSSIKKGHSERKNCSRILSNSQDDVKEFNESFDIGDSFEPINDEREQKDNKKTTKKKNDGKGELNSGSEHSLSSFGCTSSGEDEFSLVNEDSGHRVALRRSFHKSFDQSFGHFKKSGDAFEVRKKRMGRDQKAEVQAKRDSRKSAIFASLDMELDDDEEIDLFSPNRKAPSRTRSGDMLPMNARNRSKANSLSQPRRSKSVNEKIFL